jgi:hypothetical protein
MYAPHVPYAPRSSPVRPHMSYTPHSSSVCPRAHRRFGDDSFFYRGSNKQEPPVFTAFGPNCLYLDCSDFGDLGLFGCKG